MKLHQKLHHIALTGLLAAGSAHAAIDAGTQGNGELFFNIWDSTQSYTFDLNVTIDAFQAQLANAGALNLAFGLDLAYASFLAGVANTDALRWNVIANDTSGARRILTTYTPPEDATPVGADSGRSVTGAIQAKVLNINLGLVGDSGIFLSSDDGYTGAEYPANPPYLYGLGFDTSGSLANNSYATGLGFMRVDCGAIGSSACGLNEYLDEGLAVKTWVDADNTLHIAAVPEPETYAMLLAGLGLVGWMARRRKAV